MQGNDGTMEIENTPVTILFFTKYTGRDYLSLGGVARRQQLEMCTSNQRAQRHRSTLRVALLIILLLAVGMHMYAALFPPLVPAAYLHRPALSSLERLPLFLRRAHVFATTLTELDLVRKSTDSRSDHLDELDH